MMIDCKNQSLAALSMMGAAMVSTGAIAQNCNPNELFGPPLSYMASADDAASIVHADFNGDGYMDVATEDDTGAGFVSVLLGDGLGGFGPRAVFATNQVQPWGLSVGDVNGDGFVDIAAGDEEDPNIAILLGNGDGTFQQTLSVSLTIPRSRDTVLVDMDGDSKLDLLASDPNGDRLWLLRGTGDGTFFGATPIPAGNQPDYFSVGDADGDGNLDLIVSNFLDDTVSLIRGNGQGQFFAQEIFTAGNGPKRPVLADVNSDGIMDVVVANNFWDSVSVLLGLDGRSYQPMVLYSVGDRPRHVRVEDFTGDGVLDIVVANENTHDVSLLVGIGDGSFASEVRIGAGDQPVDGTAFDANGDGALDLVVINRTSEDVTPLLNTCLPSVSIVSHPVDVIAETGSSAAFLVEASGPEPMSYQWLFNGAPLSDGDDISGTTTEMLIVNRIRPDSSGFYTARVIADGDSIESDQARLGVILACPADLNGDDLLDLSDISTFVQSFTTGCP